MTGGAPGAKTRPVLSLRRLALNHRRLAGLVLGLVLAMRLVMPAGFMPAVFDGHIVVSICSGSGPATMVVAVPGAAHGKAGEADHQGKAAAPCAFAGLHAPALAAVDPILLAAAILFIMAVGIRAAAPPPAGDAHHLRPPSRAPPAV